MGVLSGYRVVELAGIGPGPMTGMMLADMGAEVIVVERIAGGRPMPRDASYRGKRSLRLDLKDARAVEALLRIVAGADALIDPFRPGVCERLGIGPDTCLARNPRLVYGRMTGWGQDGPLAQAAGHDINYIAITGALHAIGRREGPPVPPLNLVGDMGGGGLLLLAGLLAALLEVERSGRGQVVDAAMVDGAAIQMWMAHSMHASGQWDAARREANLLDGAAHFYDTYECADGRYVAVGAIEPQFYARLIELAGADPAQFEPQMQAQRWPEMKARLAALFRSRTRDEWCEILEGTDACFAPVLSFAEAPAHPANVARRTYVDVDGFAQPAPAPRFSRTPSGVRHGAREPGADTAAVLAEAGLSEPEIEALRSAGVAG